MSSPVGCEPLPVDWRDWIESAQFVCLGARASLRRGQAFFLRLGDIVKPDLASIHAALRELRPLVDNPASETATLIVAFNAASVLPPAEFHDQLWAVLRGLRDLDRAMGFPYADGCSADPAAPDFAVSVAGEAYFVVGTTPSAERISRRSPCPAMAFNSHRQFRRLRQRNRYDGLRDQIRRRDIKLQGSVNPTLGDFGSTSDAPQYSSHVPEGLDPQDPDHIDF